MAEPGWIIVWQINLVVNALFENGHWQDIWRNMRISSRCACVLSLG
jgi:hypothetical protein